MNFSKAIFFLHARVVRYICPLSYSSPTKGLFHKYPWTTEVTMFYPRLTTIYETKLHKDVHREERSDACEHEVLQHLSLFGG